MAEHPDPRNWRLTVGPRLIVVGALFAVWTLTVFARLVDLQVFQHDALETRARKQQTSRTDVPAQRGDILDRHRKVLAYSVDEDTVCADPSKLKDPRQAAVRLCNALGDCSDTRRAALERRLGQQSDKFAYISHWVTDEQARRVAALKIDGVFLKKEPHRYYPKKELAAHVLGFVGKEYRGLEGLEANYDHLLRGTPGEMWVQEDAVGRVFSRVGRPPVPGVALELTIDANLQHIAERELRAGVDENRAIGGSVVIMDPTTGEILALASEPSFDANNFSVTPADSRRNRAIQDCYEPGSTFKIVTGSAALEEKVMRPTDLIETGNGTIWVGPERHIRDAQGHAYGTLSFEDVIVKSSNVGAVKIGFGVGAERLGRFVESFGFGTKLSPDFRGEHRGIVWRPSLWTESTLASVSIGYEVSVTPLQMAAAASAVANGGELVMPRVVRAVIDRDRRLPVPRKVIRRVISAETAAEMTSILEGVVEDGTGTLARLPDFTVAGKTGTANKNRGGRYLKDVNASFVGFVPSRKPALTVLVVIDTPRGRNQPFGGTVAAPIFRRIAEAALRYLGVPPTVNPLPPVLIARDGSADPINVTGPAVPLTIVPAVNPSSLGRIVLPELRGLSGREALRVLTRLGFTPSVSGNGIVISQDPLPGNPVEAGGSCRLTLGRPAPGLRP